MTTTNDLPYPNELIEEGRWNTVSQGLLHKHSASECIVTQHSDRGAAQMFRLRINSAHALNKDMRMPLTLGLEAVRQIGLALCHLHGHVPLDWAFILQRATFKWLQTPLNFSDGGQVELSAMCFVDRTVERQGIATETVARTLLFKGFHPVASGSGHIRCLPTRAYQALRRNARSRSDTVIPPGPHPLSEVHFDHGQLFAVLGWTHPHPFFFDHEVDHVPGMLIAQAATDAHRAITGEDAHGISLSCDRYAELGNPVSIHAQSQAMQTRTTFTQGGAHVAQALTIGALPQGEACE